MMPGRSSSHSEANRGPGIARNHSRALGPERRWVWFPGIDCSQLSDVGLDFAAVLRVRHPHEAPVHPLRPHLSPRNLPHHFLLHPTGLYPPFSRSGRNLRFVVRASSGIHCRICSR
eukprot:2705787-Rhodomonas_salina.1